jgi:hypothetical protein
MGDLGVDSDTVNTLVPTKMNFSRRHLFREEYSNRREWRL